MTPSPVIIATGGANLASLRFALGRLGFEAPVTEDADRIRAASHVILPGVGAARGAMRRLDSTGLTRTIPELTQPVLGICLGMQLLFTGSDEDDAQCLGVIDGVARRFPGGEHLPVPQMGWNQLTLERPSALLQGLTDGDYAYFLHSYAVPVGPHTLAKTEYGIAFSAIVERGNFFGAQFHPERSARVGAKLLENFLRLS